MGNKEKTQKEKARDILDAMWVTFDEYGGYEYNDDILVEISGAEETYDENLEEEEDLQWLVIELTESMNYINHLVEIIILKDTIPPPNYC